jgi:K+-sensing histidine kinase KdpD
MSRTPEVKEAIRVSRNHPLSTWASSTLAAEVDRLEQRAESAETKVQAQAERIRYLEGATNHATGTPLAKAEARVKELEADYSHSLNALCIEGHTIEALKQDNAKLRAALKPLLRFRPDGDIGWRGNLSAKCGYILVRDVLVIEAALADTKGTA